MEEKAWTTGVVYSCQSSSLWQNLISWLSMSSVTNGRLIATPSDLIVSRFALRRYELVSQPVGNGRAQFWKFQSCWVGAAIHRPMCIVILITSGQWICLRLHLTSSTDKHVPLAKKTAQRLAETYTSVSGTPQKFERVLFSNQVYSKLQAVLHTFSSVWIPAFKALTSFYFYRKVRENWSITSNSVVRQDLITVRTLQYWSCNFLHRTPWCGLPQ